MILAVLTSPVWITVAPVLAAILVAILACVFAVAVSIVAVMAALVIHRICIGGIGVGYLFHKRRGSRSWTVRAVDFGSCAWSTCSVACGMVLWLVCPMGSERHSAWLLQKRHLARQREECEMK